MTRGQSTLFVKSHTNVIRWVLMSVSIVLFIAVVGICGFVVLNHTSGNKNSITEGEYFRFALQNGTVTVVEFLDRDATTCEIPATASFDDKTYPVTIIGKNAFTNCSSLEEVVIPASVTHIQGDEDEGKGAFSGCTSLKSINWGSNLTHIGAYAFKNCIELKTVDISTNMQAVGEGAFQGCLGLEKVVMDSNGNFGESCFFNCLNATTLSLGKNIKLTDDIRKALSDLTGITNLIVSEENSNYTFDENNHCLLSETTNEDDTLVLATCQTKDVPVSVTNILDWAWGACSEGGIYIPDTVVKIGEHAFASQTVYTNATTKPTEWAVENVITDAQKVTFKADEDHQASACIYEDEEGEIDYPEYEVLFPELKPVTPFVNWERESESSTVYIPVFKDDSKGSVEKKADLTREKIIAEDYLIVQENKCMQFKIDFWEDFKSVYYQVDKILTGDNYKNTYNFTMVDLCTQLAAMNEIIDTLSAEYLESADWDVRLQNLVNAVNQLELEDYISAGNSEANISKLNELVNKAEDVLNGNSDESIEEICINLRNAFENIVVNVGESGPLGTEIKICKDLKRANYTKESWQNLQTCLAEAEKITEHNLTISLVRKKLQDARLALEEVNLEANLATFGTWLSICDDFVESDYEYKEYDRLVIELLLIEGNMNDLIISRNKMDAATGQIKNLYSQLVFKDKPAEHTSIFNLNTMPYFIAAVLLFTGAVVVGSISMKLKQQMGYGR